MSIKSLPQSEFSFQYHVVFKERKEGLAVKVYDASKNCLFKTEMTGNSWALSGIPAEFRPPQPLDLTDQFQEAIKICGAKIAPDNEPVPNFTHFEQANPELVGLQCSVAQAEMKAGNFKGAINALTQALKYTNNWSDYLEVPALYEKIEAHDKALLANLYLAEAQFKADNLSEAISTIEKVHQGNPSVTLILFSLYQCNNQPEKALKVAQENQSPHLLEQVLTKYPNEYAFYHLLAGQAKDLSLQTHILRKGATHAQEEGNLTAAQELLAQIKNPLTTFDEELPQLRQFALTGQKDALTSRLVDLEQLPPKEALKARKMHFAFTQAPSTSEAILRAYTDLGKLPEQTKWYQRQMGLLSDPGKNQLQMQSQILHLQQQLAVTTQELGVSQQKLLATQQELEATKQELSITHQELEDRVLRTLPGVTVLDGGDWARCFDLSEFGLSVADEPRFNSKQMASLLLDLQQKLSIKGDAGITLLTLPRGLSSQNLIKLVEAPLKGRGVKFKDVLSGFTTNYGNEELNKTERIVITNNVLKHSDKKGRQASIESLATMGCHMPRTIEVMALCAITSVATQKRFYGDTSRAATRCQEIIDGYPIFVGDFTTEGLSVFTPNWVGSNPGTAAVYKLKTHQ